MRRWKWLSVFVWGHLRGTEAFFNKLTAVEKKLFLRREVLVLMDQSLFPGGRGWKSACPRWEGLAAMLVAHVWALETHSSVVIGSCSRLPSQQSRWHVAAWSCPCSGCSKPDHDWGCAKGFDNGCVKVHQDPHWEVRLLQLPLEIKSLQSLFSEGVDGVEYSWVVLSKQKGSTEVTGVSHRVMGDKSWLLSKIYCHLHFLETCCSYCTNLSHSSLPTPNLHQRWVMCHL